MARGESDGALFVFLCATLVSVGLKVFYPLAVFLLALGASLLRKRWQISREEEEEVEMPRNLCMRENAGADLPSPSP